MKDNREAADNNNTKLLLLVSLYINVIFDFAQVLRVLQTMALLRIHSASKLSFSKLQALYCFPQKEVAECQKVLQLIKQNLGFPPLMACRR